MVFILLLPVAEIAASWLSWGLFPSDTIRVAYPGFLTFEAGRLKSWVPVFAAIIIISMVRLFWRRNRAPNDHVGQLRHGGGWILIGSAVLVEALTSAVYWLTTASWHVRIFYRSTQYWNRVPESSELGWPAFQVYLLQHFLPWVSVMLVGITLWLMVEKRTKNATACNKA
jgi:hypothetical protein